MREITAKVGGGIAKFGDRGSYALKLLVNHDFNMVLCVYSRRRKKRMQFKKNKLTNYQTIVLRNLLHLHSKDQNNFFNFYTITCLCWSIHFEIMDVISFFTSPLS